MTTIIICGDRWWNDRQMIMDQLKKRPDVTHVIQGECRGADVMGRDCAKELELIVSKFPAEWKRYGKAAGIIRNGVMLKTLQACQGSKEVWAFHDELFDKSRGTRDMVKKASASGIRCINFRHGLKPVEIYYEGRFQKFRDYIEGE